jgi:hypothetical protein
MEASAKISQAAEIPELKLVLPKSVTSRAVPRKRCLASAF